MKILDLVQGSDEWLEARAMYRTASEAPCMMGDGKTKRSELMRMKATGDSQEFSRWVLEVLFAKGHEVEALARPLAEAIIGDELFPVTGVDDAGYMLASFDGLTMGEDIAWECKQWNDAKATNVRDGVLPQVDYWQVIQQLLVSGADRLLYMVTDGTSEKCVHMWVSLNSGDGAALLASWAQFDKDLADYVPVEVVVEAVGRAPEDLPALRLEVTGAVTASNLTAFRDHALAVFGGINRDLASDVDFANAEKTVKWCGEVERKLKAAKQSALEQTASIDELFQAIDAIAGESRTVRLELEKLVKARKESVRGEILVAVRGLLEAHLGALTIELGAGGVVMPDVANDFPGVMKNKRTIASLQDAVDTELARCKVEADRVAKAIKSNLDLLAEASEGYGSLFPDTQSLVMKEPGDLLAVVKSRIADYQAEQQRILEEQAKADEPVVETPAVETPAVEEQPTRRRLVPNEEDATPPWERPSHADLLRVLSSHYNVEIMVVAGWLRDDATRRAA